MLKRSPDDIVCSRMTSLVDRLKALAVRTPLVSTAVRAWTALSFRGSRAYWERRYHRRGTSGLGSRGRLAREKAATINDLIVEHAVDSVVDFGCGDGFVAGLLRCPQYIGLDVSETAITRCRAQFDRDESRVFHVYDPATHNSLAPYLTEMALSLDVIYHLTEEEAFRLYMRHLFDSAQRFVLIYSTAQEQPTVVAHVRHRDFRRWIADNRPDWELASTIELPGHTCDFNLYAKPDRSIAAE